MNFDFLSGTPRVVSLPAALDRIEDAQLVRQVSDEESTYLFKHALVQDTAHASLLRHDNKRLHRLVAYALENVNANRLDEYAAELARHYAEAEEETKTFEYSLRAGDVAARVFANAEALTHYGRAIQIARRGIASPEQVIHLYKQRGRLLEVTGKYQDALAGYQELHTLAEERSDRRLELAYLTLRAPLHSAPMPTFDPNLAKQLLLDALGTARELGDQAVEARVLWNLSLLSVHTMNPTDGLMYGELSLALCEKLGLHDQMAYTLHDLYIPYRAAGQIERATEANAQARAIFRELDNKPMLADNLGMSAQFTMYEGNLDSGLSFGMEGLEVSRTIGNPFGISFNQSFVVMPHLERGELTEALEVLGEHAGELESIVPSLNAVWITVVLGWYLATLGNIHRSRHFIRAAQDPRWYPLPPMFRSGVAALFGRVALLRGDMETALAQITQVANTGTMNVALQPGTIQLPLAQAELALAERNFADVFTVLTPQEEWLRTGGYRLVLPENLYLQGRAHMGLEEWDNAAAKLYEVLAPAQAMNTRRILWQILAALCQVETVRGNLAQANLLRDQACEVIQEIVAHTPHEYREGFLNLPRVREVLR